MEQLETCTKTKKRNIKLTLQIDRLIITKLCLTQQTALSQKAVTHLPYQNLIMLSAHTKSEDSTKTDINNNQHRDSYAPYYTTFEPRHEKTGFLHMRKQRRRSASW